MALWSNPPSIRMYIFSDYDLKEIESRVMNKYDEDNGRILLITRVRIDEQKMKRTLASFHNSLRQLSLLSDASQIGWRKRESKGALLSVFQR